MPDALPTSAPAEASATAAPVPMVRIVASGGSLGCQLENLIASALECFARERVVVNAEEGLINQLQALAEKIKSQGRIGDFQRAVQQAHALQAYFNLPDPNAPDTNHAQVRFFTSPDKCRAFMAVTPPRGDGNHLTLNTVAALLDQVGIVRNLDLKKIETIVEKSRRERDIFWGVPIAAGTAPLPEQPGFINFRVPVVDKDLFRRSLAAMPEALRNLGEPLEDGDIIGVLSNFHTAQSGIDVFGRPVQPPASAVALELSDDIQRSEEGVLMAKGSGYVVSSGRRLELMPFYLLASATGAAQSDLSFPGAVLVQGDLVGPMQIECDDLFVLGNCEQVRLLARGDVFITGGIVGHHQTILEADGDIYAGFVSEATLSALGDIVIENAVINSRLTSNGSIRVRSEKGMIAGGSLAALKSIAVATLGSEFGMFTETAAGKDFLTAARLEAIAARIAMHAENLRRIQDLKRQIVRWRASLENLPPDKQEILINVLRKERNSEMELKSLNRRRARLNRALHDFFSASIEVADSLYPPARVQICDAIQEIREKLQSVTLKYDEHRKAVELTSKANTASG